MPIYTSKNPQPWAIASEKFSTVFFGLLGWTTEVVCGPSSQTLFIQRGKKECSLYSTMGGIGVQGAQQDPRGAGGRLVPAAPCRCQHLLRTRFGLLNPALQWQLCIRSEKMCRAFVSASQHFYLFKNTLVPKSPTPKPPQSGG